jgi:methionyl aminopeptidase
MAYAAAQKVVEIHRRLSGWLKPGMTLPEIDAFVAKQLVDLGCKSAFKDYRTGSHPPFPSHACLSVNDCVVHGTAGYYAIEGTFTPKPVVEGDLLKIDVGVRDKSGWIGDAAWTYVFGEPSPLVKKLTECGKEALRRGVKELRPGNTYLAFARAVQGYVEGECKFHLIRGLGGHGYGRSLHKPPYVSNTVPTYPGEWPDAHLPCRPGTLVAVEPMIAVGTGMTVQKVASGRRTEWPVFTKDGSMSVHYEHDVLITEHGPRVLTAELEELNDVIT